jgi:hypothetical protein
MHVSAMRCFTPPGSSAKPVYGSHQDERLPSACSTEVGDRAIEATVESGEGALAQIGEDEREVRAVECGEECEARVRTRPNVDSRTRR